MLEGKKNIESYMENYNFNENNIHFRIYSSKALEKYKHYQSFNLNQLVHGKFPFRKTSKEILLLKYDMWFRWLMRIEGYIVANNIEKIKEEHIDIFLYYASLTNALYQKTMQEYPQYFNPSFLNIWMKFHTLLHKYLHTQLKLSPTTDSTYFFNHISDILIEVMDSTVYELVEMEVMLNKYEISICPNKNKMEEFSPAGSVPFLIYNSIGENYYKIINESLLANRVKLYKNYIPTLDKVYIKNYTDFSIPEVEINLIQKEIEIDFYSSITNQNL